MADNLDKDFDQEKDLSDSFDQEVDLSVEFDQVESPTEDEKTSATEAFLAGGFQDLSLGLSDELKGALEAAGQAVGVKGLGQEFGKQEFQEPIGLDVDKLGEAYKQGRDLERQRIEQAKIDEPGAFQAGEIAGMVGPAVATGGAAAAKGLLTKGTKEIAKRFLKKGTQETLEKTAKEQAKELAKSGAQMGGASAIGYSESEDPIELAKEGTVGAGLGAATALAVPSGINLSKKALKKAGQGLKEGSKQVASVLSGLRSGTIDDIIKRADDIKEAVDYPEIQEIVMDKSRKVLSDIEKFGRAASDMLSDEKSIAKEAIKDRLEKRIAKIVNTADDPAIPHLQKITQLIDDQNKFGGELLSLRDIQKIVQDTGKRAYRGISKDSPGAVKKQLRETYHELSEILKEAAPKNYRKTAKEISDRYNLLDKLDKKLGIQVDYDEVLQGSEDKLMRKLQEVGKEDLSGRSKVDVENLLNELEEIRGKKIDDKSLADLLKARRLQGELDKGAGEYSYAARTLTGGLLGSALPGVGNVVGVAAGLASRPLSRALLKRSGPLGRAKISEKASRFVDKAGEIVSPFALGKAGTQSGKVAVDSVTTSNKFDDPKYMENLIQEFENSGIPGASAYAEQLEQYKNTDNQQEKTQIQYNLSQQPAFRQLLKEYDDIKQKK